MQGLLDQSDRMNIGFEMAKGGDMLAGSQAILISFNKLLDPTSVVRESEYARFASGQSALETLKGYADRLSKGGAGVTLEELASYKRFGEQVVQKAMESTVGPERERISRLVKFAGVDPELIFTGRFASDAAPPGSPQPQQAPQRAQGLPQQVAAPPQQAQVQPRPQQAPQQPMLGALAQALTGGPTTPAQPQGPAAGGAGPSPADSLGQQRVQDYGALDPVALERQVGQMAAKLAVNPKAYSQEEIDAAKVAYDRAFPGR